MPTTTPPARSSNYAVTVTVQDIVGATGSAAAQVTVNNVPRPSRSPAARAPSRALPIR